MSQTEDDLLRGIAAAPPSFDAGRLDGAGGPAKTGARKGAPTRRPASAPGAAQPEEPPLAERLALLRGQLAAWVSMASSLQRTDAFNSEYLPGARLSAWPG